MPAELHDVILDFRWDIERLHALDLPTCTVAASDLAWHLDLPFWSVRGVPFQISPTEVAANPALHQKHWQRTLAAELRYPLDAYLLWDGQIVVLDGIHRLLKASLMDRTDIPVRVLAPHQFGAIAVLQPLDTIPTDHAAEEFRTRTPVTQAGQLNPERHLLPTVAHPIVFS